MGAVRWGKGIAVYAKNPGITSLLWLTCGNEGRWLETSNLCAECLQPNQTPH